MPFLTLSDLPDATVTGEPRLSLHRGGMNVAPENTLQALDSMVSLGVQLVEIDVWGTVDGTLVVIHDSRTDRTTDIDTSSDNLNALSVGGITVDPHKSLKTGVKSDQGWAKESLPTLDKMFREFAGKICFVVELKNNKSKDIVSEVVFRHGMENSVIIHTQGLGNMGRLGPAITQGLETMIAPGQVLDTTTAQSIANYGIEWVSLGGSNASTSSVAEALAQGLKVSLALPNMRWDYENRLQVHANAGNVIHEVLTDEPLYLRGTQHVVDHDPWGSGTFYHGHHGRNSGSGAERKGYFYSINSGWRFAFPENYNPNSGAAGEDQLLMGWACPLRDESFRMVFGMNVLEASSFPRIIVPICHSTDKPWNEWDSGTDVNGYMLYANGNGDLRIYRHDGASLTRLGTASTSGFTVGSYVYFEVEVTPTQIKWSRTNGSVASVVVNDSIYRGKYLWLGTREMVSRFYSLHVYYD